MAVVGEEREIIVKYIQIILHNKDQLSRENDFTRIYQSWGRAFSPTLTPLLSYIRDSREG